ncbi:L-seryl-tRNA(Sec) selenium transferase, partial [Nonomuraea sp. NPDC001023]
APGVSLPSAAVALDRRAAAALRRARPPVLARVEDGRCLLDLRAVPSGHDDTLLAAVLTAWPAG